jgi:murein DD-endopeptidase MepM/ murein hydrolase activator NlpD
MIRRVRRVWNRRLDAWSDRLHFWSSVWRGRPRTTRAIVACVAFLLSGWLTMTSANYFGSQALLSEARERIRTLQRAHAELRAETELLTSAFLEQIDHLEARSEQHQAALIGLTRTRAALQDQLDSRAAQLASIAEQRDRARDLVDEMRQAIAGAEDLLGAVAEERLVLRRRLEAAEDQVTEVSGQRDASRRVQVGLRWQLAQLEDEVERLRSHRDDAQTWLKDWVLGSVEALEDLFVATGVDVDELVARAADAPAPGQGGPLEVAAPDQVVALASPPDDPISNSIQRLAALQRVARSLPLASPLDQFHVTSPYGKRRDPFTQAWAFHAGLDLGGSRKAEVLATAPGQVIFAGPSGPYGKMVEVDHGMGIVTRYAHLGSIEVGVGEEVEFRHALGIIGNTGRSTSRHLHYEIRIDGRAFDPANFLDAGRLLVGVFDAHRVAEASR